MNEGSIAESLLEAKDFREKVNKIINLKRNIIKKGLKEYDFFFNKSIVLRTLIAKMFMDYSDIDVDENEVLTAVLLCNTKKVDNAQTIEKVHSYAKEGADFLKEKFLFNNRFCTICEQLNRYSKSEPRTTEGDILEVIDQFTGLILSRPDRPAFSIEKAMLELQSNLSKHNNTVLDKFSKFVNVMQKTRIKDNTESDVLGKLVRLCEHAYATREEIESGKYSREELQFIETKGFFNELAMKYLVRIDKLVKNMGEKEAKKKENNNVKKIEVGVENNNVTKQKKNTYKGVIPQIHKALLKTKKKIDKISEINTGEKIALFANSVKFSGIEFEDIGIDDEREA